MFCIYFRCFLILLKDAPKYGVCYIPKNPISTVIDDVMIGANDVIVSVLTQMCSY